MPQTPYGVTYPNPDEPVAEGAARIRDVAEALDGRVLAGRLDWGPLGAPTDTWLARGGVALLVTNGGLIVANGTARDVELGIDRLGGGQAAVNFGPDGDTRLYRAAAGELRTPGQLTVDGGFYAAGYCSLGGGVLSIYANGHTYLSGNFWLVPNTAGLTGSGDKVRVLGGGITVDGAVVAAEGAAAQIAISGGNIYFGPLNDVNLYRYAADHLRTSDHFTADGGITSAGPSGSVTADTEVLGAHLRAHSTGYFGDPHVALVNVGAYPGGETGVLKLFCENPDGKLRLQVIWPSGAKSTIAAEP